MVAVQGSTSPWLAAQLGQRVEIGFVITHMVPSLARVVEIPQQFPSQPCSHGSVVQATAKSTIGRTREHAGTSVVPSFRCVAMGNTGVVLLLRGCAVRLAEPLVRPNHVRIFEGPDWTPEGCAGFKVSAVPRSLGFYVLVYKMDRRAHALGHRMCLPR